MADHVGIDWAAAVHAGCVVDDAGRVRWHGTVGHSAAGAKRDPGDAFMLADILRTDGILARSWIRILWRCWQDGVPYDLTRHRGAVAA